MNSSQVDINNNSKKLKDERDWIKKENIFTSSFIVQDGPCCCFITLHQPNIRNLIDTDVINDLRPPLAYIIVAKYDRKNNTYSFISSEMVNWEKLIIQQTIEKGEYHIFAKTYWNYNQPYNLVVSTYSDNIEEINPLHLDQIPEDWLSQILTDMGRRTANKEYPFPDEPSSYTSNLMFDNNNFTGFCLFYYQNSSRHGTMCINLKFKTLRGLKIMNLEYLLMLEGSEYIENSEKSNSENFGSCNLVFKIPPLSSIGVIMKVINLPWNCTVDWYHDIWFDFPVEIMINRMRKNENTEKIELEKNLLYLNEMEHKRGVIITIENFNSVDYNFLFDINVLKNLYISDTEDIIKSDNDRRLEFTIKSKDIKILNFKIIKSPKEIPYKLRYVYKFYLNK